jgi:iron-sulfur cluster repair protein YtfE (RIC family)
MGNPVVQLEHDHTGFSQVIAALRGRLGAHPSAREKVDASAVSIVEALSEELLVHFAREEEGLFPYVTRAFPEVGPAIDRLLAGHDVVCGCLVRLAHLLGRPGDREAAHALFDRFERAYAEHARAEIAVLRELDARLTPEQRQEIAALVEGL